jgi:hypothetical protein
MEENKQKRFLKDNQLISSSLDIQENHSKKLKMKYPHEKPLPAKLKMT